MAGNYALQFSSHMLFTRSTTCTAYNNIKASSCFPAYSLSSFETGVTP